MKSLIVSLFVVCLVKDITGTYIFTYREPSTYQTDYCCETPSGVVSCGCGSRSCSCGSCNTCGTMTSETVCNCGPPCCKDFKDTSNTCSCCCEKSPVCSCFSCLNGDRGCGCGDDCGCKSDCGCGCGKTCVYFPEVEYPSTIIEMNPLFFGSCFSF